MTNKGSISEINREELVTGTIKYRQFHAFLDEQSLLRAADHDSKWTFHWSITAKCLMLMRNLWDMLMIGTKVLVITIR